MGIWNELDEPVETEAVYPDDELPPLNSYVRLVGEMHVYYDPERRGPCEVVPDGAYGQVIYHLHEDPQAVGVRWFRHPVGEDEGRAILTTAEVNVAAVERVSDREFEGWMYPPWRDLTGWRVAALFAIIALVTILIVARIVTG